MNSIDKLQAAKKVQQALRKNPNNVEALLQLARMLGTLKQPDLAQKRKVLHRVLSLEPNHRTARQMLFETDRAAIGGNPSRLSAAVILTDPSSSHIAEAPLILRYSLLYQLLVYLLIVFTIIIALCNIQNSDALVIAGVILLFLMIPLWFVSAVVEISETRITASHLFGMVCWQVAYREIQEFKPYTVGKGIRIIARPANVVRISSHITGYFAVIEILRQMRPDLFEVNKVIDASP